jgi:hypothetical protein
MHRSLCGLYSKQPRNLRDTLNDGIQREVVERMAKIAPAEVTPRGFGLAWVLEFPPAAWERTLGAMLDESGVERRMNHAVTRVQRDGRRIAAVEIGDRERIAASVVIDCSGGRALELAGVEAVQPIDEVQIRNLAGYAMRLAGLGGDGEMLRLQTPYVLAKAVDARRLPALARFTVFYTGPGEGEGVCKLAIGAATMSSEEVMRFAGGVIDELRRELPGFGSARIVEASMRPVARDGRRLRGIATVTEDDVLNARRRDGEVVHAWWPIERWSATDGPSYGFGPAGEHYDIPLDALRSAAVENLLAAGMCASATHGAMGSMRVSGISLATGAMAGRFAAKLIAASTSSGRDSRRAT